MLPRFFEKLSKIVQKASLLKFSHKILKNQGIFPSRNFSLATVLVISAVIPKGKVIKHTFKTKYTQPKLRKHNPQTYNNYLIMGDFNLEPHDKRLGYFLNSNNLVNLVKTNTCFKGSGSCIGLILTDRKYSFKNTTSYETGLSDHHHMILTMLKTTFQQKEPKCFSYRDYKNFVFEISKVIFRKPYRAARAHMMHLATISPPSLINMLQKRKRYFGEMKSLI